MGNMDGESPPIILKKATYNIPEMCKMFCMSRPHMELKIKELGIIKINIAKANAKISSYRINQSEVYRFIKLTGLIPIEKTNDS